MYANDAQNTLHVGCMVHGSVEQKLTINPTNYIVNDSTRNMMTINQIANFTIELTVSVTQC